MPLRPELLDAYLSKGQFPLLDQRGLGLWDNLVGELEANGEQTIKTVKQAMSDRKRFEFGEVFPPTIEVNEIEIATGQTDLERFIGAAHARLSENHGIAVRPAVQGLIQRLRTLMQASLKKSKIVLGLDPHLAMGNGLVADRLTCLPDPAWKVSFGSVPDQDEIGMKAPAWRALKRRTYESPPPVRYGAKPHYVLAHLLNHNVNGPGDNPRNVLPFWAAANTKMAQQVEGYLKELVLQGLMVRYVIQVGGDVGMTPGRQAALDACTNDAQRAIVNFEQYLPSHLVISIHCIDLATGDEQVIVPGCTIDNYVPETVPLLR